MPVRLSGSPVLPAPWTWQRFMAYLALPRRAAQEFWRALCQSQWQAALGLRQSFVLYAAVRLAPAGLLEHAACPAVVVEVLENLHREGLLPRAQVTALEEAILRRTTIDGGWQPWAVPDETQRR